MPLPVLQFRPETMEQASPAYFGLRNLQDALSRKIQDRARMQQQQAAQQTLPLQLQQMKGAIAAQEQQQALAPFQQQLLEAKIGKTQAETSALPMKRQMDMMLKQRTQDNRIIELGTNNPDLMSDPSFVQQFQQAKSRISQDLPFGMGQPGMQPGMQQGLQQPQIPGAQPGIQQQLPGDQQPVMGQEPQEPGMQVPDIAEQMQLRQEQKLIPSDLKNQMVRSGSASLMIEDLKNTLNELKPFFGVTGSLKGAVRAYAASKGISDDEQGRMYNSLNKKIMATAGEVAAGMTKSRAESTLKEWQDIVNPITGRGVGYKQVMNNLNALNDIHDINSEALFENYPISKKHHDNWMTSRKKRIQDKYAPTGVSVTQPISAAQEPQFSQSQIMDELKRRGLS